MTLFFKHILRTVRRAPLQPLLILLTVTLATAVGVTAFRVRDMFAEHAAQSADYAEEMGDVVVSLRADSKVRMLFCEDAQAAVGENGTVFGEFALTVFCAGENGAKTLSAAAVELEAADRYFAFSYLEYGAFHTQNLSHAVILSEGCAERLGVGVGDSLTLGVLDVEQIYTVQAIAEESGLLSERDVLLPIESVTRVLAARVPAVAALGDSFRPYNRLLIRAEEGTDAEFLLMALSSSGLFDGVQLEKTASAAQVAHTTLVQTVAVSLLSLLLVLLCGMLLATSLSLLRAQRSMEYALFCSAGASRASLGLLQLTESWIYAALGGVAGVFLAAPMLNFVHGLFEWQTAPLYVEASGILFGLAFSLILMTVCTLLHLRRNRAVTLAVWLQENEGTDTDAALPASRVLMPLCICLLFAVALAAVPTPYRYLPGIALILCAVWLLYASVSLLIRLAAQGAERLTERARRPIPWLSIAFKNVGNHAAIRHTGRLLSVLLMLLLAVTAFISVVDDQLILVNDMIRAELVVANLPSADAETLRDNPNVEGYLRLAFVSGGELENGYTAMVVMLAGDANTCLEPDLLPATVPKGDQAALSKGVAELLGADVGECVTVGIQGVWHTFTVSEIVSVTPNLIFLDLDTIRPAGEVLCVKLTEGAANDPAILSPLIAEMESRGGTVLERESVTESMDASLHGFLALMRWTLFAALVPSLLGGANVFAEQFRARKHERELMRLSGMDGCTLTLMHLAELAAVILLAVLLAAVFGAAICLCLDFSVRSFGFILF